MITRESELAAIEEWTDLAKVLFNEGIDTDAMTEDETKEAIDVWNNDRTRYLDPDLAGHLMVVARAVGLAQQLAFRAPRIGMEIAGFEVAHCHLHVLPIWGEDDLHLSRSARSVEPETLVAAALQIRSALDELGLEP